MKKLHHNNLVGLVEVLDDPDEDSLYMVLEMCKRGVIMHVNMEERADPYDEQHCRMWFRDLILGIEYRRSFCEESCTPINFLGLVHAQGVVHRDIKPDNCLLTEDYTLKVVDFGVSEMFEKASEMITAKSAGSPAFMPPELCVAKHGDVSGKAADIWSMGVTLYCLRYGRVPFEKHNVLDLYESIRSDPPDLDQESNEDFKDLMRRLLEKDPEKRITMPEIRDHPWVTQKGTDPLLSAEENTAVVVEPPTDAELDAAITSNMVNLLAVMKAVKRFKRLLFRRRPELMEGILGKASRMVQPPLSMFSRESGSKKSRKSRRSQSVDAHDRRPVEIRLATEGIHRKIEVSEDIRKLPEQVDEKVVVQGEEDDKRKVKPANGAQTELATQRDAETIPDTDLPQPREAQTEPITGKGQARDPLLDTPFLGIGTGEDVGNAELVEEMVCESPTPTDTPVYEEAYREEVDRILTSRYQAGRPTLFLNRRVSEVPGISKNPSLVGYMVMDTVKDVAKTGFARVLAKAKKKRRDLVDAAEGNVDKPEQDSGDGEDDGEDEDEEEEGDEDEDPPPRDPDPPSDPKSRQPQQRRRADEGARSAT